jgi:hypothetical protein
MSDWRSIRAASMSRFADAMLVVRIRGSSRVKV